MGIKVTATIYRWRLADTEAEPQSSDKKATAKTETTNTVSKMKNKQSMSIKSHH